MPSSAPQADLSLAQHLRPFYAANAQGYGDMLSSLVVPGDLHVRTETDQQITLQACRLVGGGVMTSLASARPLEVHHTVAHVVHEDDDILAMIALEGSGVVSQQGREMAYQTGDITFRKANMPSVSAVLEQSRVLVFRVSKERFFGPYADFAISFVPAMARAGEPLVEQVRAHILKVLPQLPDLGPASVFLAEQSLISLFGAVYCDATRPAANGNRRGDKWLGLAAYIETHLGDAELSVDAVCRAAGVSKRLLHRMFEEHGTKYGQYLLLRRLDRAKIDLCDERLRHLTVSEIAFRNGFNDASHFSRTFRLSFGISPRDCRTRPAA